MAANVELCMSFNDVYQPVLSIPVTACQRFSIHPFLWLRYVGSSSSAMNATSPVFRAAQRSIIIKLIYHLVLITMYPKASQTLLVAIYDLLLVTLILDPCLIDPDGMNDRTSDIRTSDASSISVLEKIFRREVIARDKTCVMTGATLPEGHDACHIIPHAKGHQVCLNFPWTISSS